jgi:hypothetical protein
MKDFTLYPEALELRELGFDEPCFAVYSFKKLRKGTFSNLSSTDDTILAPTYSQAFRFFREKHGLDSWIEEISHGIDNVNKRYVFQVPTPTSHLNKVMFFDTYEEAELACLKKLIELVKGK